MIYLTSPYSHPDPLVMRRRFEIARDATAFLLKRGQIIYSPIVHCHPLAEAHELPRDFAFWQRYNFGILRHCETFTILAIEGWRESEGVKGEWAMAEELSIPIRQMEVEPWHI